MFTLAVSCLTTSNLPWFMDLTFQVPTQYCSLQLQTLLPPPETSITGCCFCFGSASSYLLELFLCFPPPLGIYQPGEFIFQCRIFLPFHSVDASKVTLKILQARLQQYMNQELPDIQAGFRNSRGTKDQIVNICWVIEKHESSRKTPTSALLTMPKPFTCGSQQTVENS